MGEDLNERRLEILRFLARRRSSGDAPPSVREIGQAVGLKSKQTVFHHIRKLEESGYVERAADWTKTLSLTERGWEAVGETTLMGRIAAGRGLEAIGEEEAYSVAGELLISRTGKRRYLLRVVGESMVEARIHDGDLVVVEEDPDPPDGSVVVALLAGDEVTIKRLYRRNGSVKLKAESADHEDIVVPWGEVEIQGRVVASIHSF